jgi:hypothetical protein
LNNLPLQSVFEHNVLKHPHGVVFFQQLRNQEVPALPELVTPGTPGSYCWVRSRERWISAIVSNGVMTAIAATVISSHPSSL